MGRFPTVLLCVLLLAALILTAFFGRLPRFRNSWVGDLNRALFRTLPGNAVSLARLLCGGRFGNRLSRLGSRLMYEKHPLVMIFFLGLVTLSAALFIYNAHQHLSPTQLLVALILVPVPHVFTFLCARTSPDLFITAASHRARVADYPYDYALFHPRRACGTCRLQKPARSKHCSLCKSCVARADHHCVWVNNCIGRGNYKYFLILLFGTGLLLVFAAHTAHSVLSPLVLSDRRFMRRRAARPDGEGVFSSAFSYAIDWTDIALYRGGLSVCGVGMLAFLTIPLPFALLSYHFFLMAQGMTTNEAAKWSDMSYHIDRKRIFRRRVDESLPEEVLRSVRDVGRWPKRPLYIFERCNDALDALTYLPGPWDRIESVRETTNLYHIDFWDYLADIWQH